MILKIERISYGVQSIGNGDIIWRHKTKWQALAKYFIKDNIIISYMSFQKRKKRKKLDLLFNLFLKTNVFKYYSMKREVIYNVLNKENLNQMMLLYLKIRIAYDRWKLFDCTNYPYTGLNLIFKNPTFAQNISAREIDPNLMKKDINPN
jgi:hypothetical protein